MMKNKYYPNLFTPIQIGSMVVLNRIAMVPTDISSANADGSVNQRVITYHEQVAKGGCGFIIVGATTPDKVTGRPTVTCVAADEDPLIPGLAHLAEAMHRYGAKCAVQIQHPGRQAAWPRKNLMSASDHVLDVPGSAGHEVIYAESIAQGKSIRAMTVEEIYDLVEKFAEAAWRVQQAGFDSVELHGAHGYLIAQFMSPFVNKRHDRFGGSFINRMRFTMEIINRIQIKCGKDFPLGIRYSGDEWIEGGRTLDESVRVAKLMEEMGLTYVDISAGIFESPGAVMDPMYYPEGWNTYAAEEVKKQLKIPVITSHSLRNPDYCEKILADGKADMVGFCRQLIADPYWANKARVDKKQEIRRCISCLVGCWQESLMIRRDMRCAINPAIGDERFIHLPPAKKVCKVAIIGGGPAGMEAARVATLRGHKVTIFERSGELGGAMLCCCTVPGKNKMRWYADWLRFQLKKLAVEVKYRTEPNAKDLKDFDVVLLASGGKVVRPDIPGIDLSFVVTFEDVLRCKNTECDHYPDDKAKPAECGQQVLIWGDHFGAADAAEKLGSAGKKVAIVTENPDFAEWMEPCHRDVMMKRFACGNGEGLKGKAYAHAVTIVGNSSVLEIKKDRKVVIVSSTFEQSTVEVDTVVLAKVEPDDSVYESLLKTGLNVARIGDAKKVRNVRGAVTDGANAALVIEEGVMLNANSELISNLPTGIDLS
ncbi:MAG: oxidoreductase [Planctomycetota bacterium]|jgi:2,4-dienoyl-CoA reductase-like NADH-dependent reductase (Old Yellow Enzyme family)/thioredoxin reductase